MSERLCWRYMIKAYGAENGRGTCPRRTPLCLCILAATCWPRMGSNGGESHASLRDQIKPRIAVGWR